MLMKIIENVSKKKSIENYARSQKRLSAFYLLLAIVAVVLIKLVYPNSFAMGMFTGVATASIVCSFVCYYRISKPEKLKRCYIETYDERNVKILSLSCQYTLVLLAAAIIIFTLLECLGVLFLTKVEILTALLYLTFLSYLLLRSFFNHYL
ncbi:hypothetical protein [Streptococcus dentiloxodontae]